MAVRVHLVIGPTGTGKSDAADLLARSLGAPVLVADRFQCLVGAAVSTARPEVDDEWVRRVFLPDRTLESGPLSGRDACAALLHTLGELSNRWPDVVVEGGSISMMAALLEFQELPFELIVLRRSMGTRAEHFERLRARTRTMVIPPTEHRPGLIEEVATAWRTPSFRRTVSTINGPEALLDWCERARISPTDLDRTRLGASDIEEIIDEIAAAHLFHAVDQERAFAAMFPAAAVAPCGDSPSAHETGSDTATVASATVTVLCGARPGRRPEYLDAAAELGRALADRGYTVCYGGASIGLMGSLADAALDAGGHVVGVIPRHLHDFEIGHPALTRQHIVPTMAERKSVMIGYTDVAIALPGGLGTLDELFEFATSTQLGLSDCVCILVDIDGFFSPLRALLHSLLDEEFISQSDIDRFIFVTTAGDAAETVTQLVSRSTVTGSSTSGSNTSARVLAGTGSVQ